MRRFLWFYCVLMKIAIRLDLVTIDSNDNFIFNFFCTGGLKGKKR
jgi:hypothetical protein